MHSFPCRNKLVGITLVFFPSGKRKHFQNFLEEMVEYRDGGWVFSCLARPRTFLFSREMNCFWHEETLSKYLAVGFNPFNAETTFV